MSIKLKSLVAASNGKRISEYRKNRGKILDKAFLLFRPGDLAQYLKPIRSVHGGRCVLTGRNIQVGDYTYPAYSNPIRICPTGRERVLVEEAYNSIASYLPYGHVIVPIPTCEEVIDLGQVKHMEAMRRKRLTAEGTKLLKEGKKIIKA